MAQTQYNPRGAYLYAEALKNQGTNPIVSWFTDSQGGGLNNWIQDQGNQIATRTRNDILRELTDDPMMAERARTAQNEGRDFRRELLGNKYFVDPHDAVLNAGIDNVKTKSENRLRKKFSEALAESLNADRYKADGTTAEALAKSLGYENLSPELLTELKEGEQSALKQRYENQLYRDIAQKKLIDPNAYVDDIIGNYRDKYGLNLNPDTYLDPENETLKKYMKAGAGNLTNEMLNAEMSARGRLEALQRLRAMHPELAQELSYGISTAQDMYDKQVLSVYTDVLNYFRDEAKKEGLGDDAARENAAGFMQREYNVDPSTLLKLQQNILAIQAGNDPTAKSKVDYDLAQENLKMVKDFLGKPTLDALTSNTLHSSIDKSLITNEVKSTLINDYELPEEDIPKFFNYLYSRPETRGALANEGTLDKLFNDSTSLTEYIGNFTNSKNALKNANALADAATARNLHFKQQSLEAKH